MYIRLYCAGDNLDKRKRERDGGKREGGRSERDDADEDDAY